MEFPCESEIDIQNDKALRFTIVTKPAPIIEYLKTIASLIGASHILGVFETNDYIKVYFDEKKYVDSIIRTGIHVMGHHIKADYVVPPGKKVILSNIDPVVTNSDLKRLMTAFGSVVSPIFRSPISDDVELCHIDYGVRYVYMSHNTTIPNILELRYGDQLCKISVKMEENLPSGQTRVKKTLVKKEPTESNITESSSNPSPSDNGDEPNNVDDGNDLDITEPIVVSVLSAVEGSSDQQNEIQSGIETNNPVVKKNLSKARSTRLAISHNNKKIRQNVKSKNRSTKSFKIAKSRKPIKNKVCLKESPRTPDKQTSPSIPSPSPCTTSTPLPPIDESFISQNFKFILDEDKLAAFLEESRRHRAPIELVKKYIGPDFDSNTLICLIVQLHDYRKKCCHDQASKVRILRLIKNLKNITNVE